MVNHPTHPHPSKLRIGVEYFDSNCDPRVKVPPDSIWVTYATSSGNVVVNDKSTQVFADDSTDGCGFARITIPSLSGCGTLSVYLYVAGVFQGSKAIVVRTTDMNADGRATADDISSGATCDLDYNGQINAADGPIVLTHNQHWHRHALHGTLVRRTNLKEMGSAGMKDAIGVGGIFWSPNGRRVTYSARDSCPTCNIIKNPCRIKYVYSDPALGNEVRNLTYNSTCPTSPCRVICPSTPCDSMDYNPSWSPLGGFVYYDRRDKVIRRKGVPGLSADTSDIAIIGGTETKTEAQVSPDGDSLAYVQFVGGRGHIFIAPAVGGSRRQLTSGTDADWRDPHWSSDGEFLSVTREDAATNQHTLWKVRVRGTPSPTRLYPPVADGSTDVQWSAISPDTQLVIAGLGANLSSDHTAHTIDGTVVSTGVAIKNYPAHTYATLYPRISPDGTRLALLAIDPAVSGATLPQLWAVRRNMSTPPRITQVGTQVVADSTVVVAINAKQGLPSSVQILSTDTEGDPISCTAAFLQNGMTFNPATCTMIWTPTAPVGTRYRVVFRASTINWPSASGGSDGIIGEFTVTDPLLAPGMRLAPATERTAGEVNGPNPMKNRFALSTPLIAGVLAELIVFDLSGRKVAVVRGPAGSILVWDGESSTGSRVPSGVYLYRLTAGEFQKHGRVALVR